MCALSQYGAMASAGAAPCTRHAWSLMRWIRVEPARPARCCACAAVIDGPWTTRFMRQKTGTDHVFFSCMRGKRGLSLFLVLELRRELQEDVLHGRGALLPGRELDVDAQAVGAGEARGAALLAD